jgi:LysM repeat protein
MKFPIPRLLVAAALALALLAGLRGPAPAVAAPPAQTNLLTNGNMESFGSNGVATGWEPWWQNTGNPGTGSLDYAVTPDFVSESNPTFVQSGGASQHIGRNWDPWFAGIRQTITVPAGATVRITAYGRVRASSDQYPTPSDGAVQSRMQIGAEPNGSIEWFANTVRWGGQANPHDTWVQLSLDVTAGSAGRVTIFLATNYKGDSRQHLDAWWDNAAATIISGGTGNTPAPGNTSAPQPTSSGSQPTNPPPAATGFLTPTPGPDGNIVYIVQPGDTLWRIAAITGVSVETIRALNGLSSDIISVGQRLIIGTGAPAATATPTVDPNVPTADPNATATSETTIPTATADAAADETQVAVVTEAAATGTVCVLLWNDANGNGVRDAQEGYLPGGQLTVVDIATGAPVDSYTTDGVNEPHCFEDLPVGQYTISSAAPAGYNPTTNTSTPLEVTEGSTSALEFGAQPSAAVADQPATPPRDSNQALLTALLFAGGVVFLLLAAGVAGFLFLRRPR